MLNEATQTEIMRLMTRIPMKRVEIIRGFRDNVFALTTDINNMLKDIYTKSGASQSNASTEISFIMNDSDAILVLITISELVPTDDAISRVPNCNGHPITLCNKSSIGVIVNTPIDLNKE